MSFLERVPLLFSSFPLADLVVFLLSFSLLNNEKQEKEKKRKKERKKKRRTITLNLNSTLGHDGGGEELFSEEFDDSAFVIGSSAASSLNLPIFAPSRIAGNSPDTAIRPQVEAVNEAAMILFRIDWTA